jgi:murein DD-endopeptidase MepM/ murein hydrolase activator NlpD
MDALDYEAVRDQDTTGDILAAAWQPRPEPRSHREPHGRLKHAARLSAIFTAATVVAVGSTATIFAGLSPEQHRNTVTAGPTPLIDAYDQDAASAQRERSALGSASRSSFRSLRPPQKMSAARAIKTITQHTQPVKNARVTSCYGSRWGTFHRGVDFAVPSGTTIRAAQGGTVVQAGWRYRGLGNSVIIKHPDSSMTLYAHASRVLVRTNQKVSAGSRVALVGSTGNSTGPHLHFAVARTTSLNHVWDSFVNPAPWLRTRGLSAGHCT